MSDHIFPEISLTLGANFIADLGFSHTPTFLPLGGQRLRYLLPHSKMQNWFDIG